jgi:hypothetical protein
VIPLVVLIATGDCSVDVVVAMSRRLVLDLKGRDRLVTGRWITIRQRLRHYPHHIGAVLLAVS